MQESIYRTLLRRSWFTVTQNKLLWALGFFAAFLGGSGEYEFLLNLYNDVSEVGLSTGANILTLGGFGGEAFVDLFTQLAAVFSVRAVFVFAVFVLVSLLLYGIVMVAQGGLVWGIASIEKAKSFSLSESIARGVASFWQLLVIGIETRLLALFVFAVIGFPLFSVMLMTNNSSEVQVLLLVIYTIGIPASILFSIVAKYAISFRMIERTSGWESVVRGMRLLGSNWLVSIEMAVVLFVVSIFAGIGFVLGLLFLAIPFVLMGLLLGQISFIGLQVLLGIGVVGVVALLLAFASALTSFQFSVWTMLSLELRKGVRPPKLVRMLTHWRQ